MTDPTLDWNAIRTDREAFHRLVDPLAPLLRGVIQREMGAALGEKTEVEDLIQETWMRAYRSIGSFRGPGLEEFRAWLIRISVRVVQDAARRRGQIGRGKGEVPLERPGGVDTTRGAVHAEDLAGSHPTPSRILRREGRYDRLQTALAGLSKDHRQVIELVRLQGLPVQEAARRMGRSPNAVSMLLLRALLQLKQRFGNTESLHLPAEPPADRNPGVESGGEEEGS